jgi:hypothetical protein
MMTIAAHGGFSALPTPVRVPRAPVGGALPFDFLLFSPSRVGMPACAFSSAPSTPGARGESGRAFLALPVVKPLVTPWVVEMSSA